MKDMDEIRDIASHVVRTHDLDDYDKVAVALELLAGTGCRPEVTAYLLEHLAEMRDDGTYLGGGLRGGPHIQRRRF